MIEVFKSIVALLAPAERRRAIFCILAMLFLAVLELAGVGLLLGIVALFLDSGGEVLKFWNHLGVEDQSTALGLSAALVAVLFIVKNLLMLLAIRMESSFVFDTQSAWSSRLYEAMLRGKFPEVSMLSNADCALRLSRVMRICDKVLLPALQIVADAILVVVLALASAFFLPLLTLSGILFLAISFLAVNFIFRKINRNCGVEAAAADAQSSNAALDGFGALREVKVFDKVDFFARKYAALQDRASQLAGKLYTLGQLPRLFLESFSLIFLLAVFVILLLTGTAQGKILLIFSAIIALLSRLLPAFSRIHYNCVTIKQYFILLEEFSDDVFNIAPENTGSGEALTFDKLLAAEKITFAYPGQAPLLREFDFTLHPGEMVGISGHTGRGKSSLLGILLGLLAPDAGKVSCDGVDIGGNLKGYRELVALVPQTPFLLRDTIRRNIGFGLPDAEIDDGKVENALRQAGIWDFVAALPEKLDFVLDPDGGNLSGGQRQRLAIARALYRQSKILFLDEPSSSLDADTENSLISVLRKLKADLAIVVVSHREALLEVCDRVVDLDKTSL